jgi:hypothetical protein
MRGKGLLLTVSLFFIFISDVLAATSQLNNGFRIFEDTLWVFVFTLMVILGILMNNLSSGKTRMGYLMLVLTGVCGWLWRSIGLVKRIFILEEPKWFFEVVREFLEGVTGVFLAVAFTLLIYSLIKIFKK